MLNGWGTCASPLAPFPCAQSPRDEMLQLSTKALDAIKDRQLANSASCCQLPAIFHPSAIWYNEKLPCGRWSVYSISTRVVIIETHERVIPTPQASDGEIGSFTPGAMRSVWCDGTKKMRAAKTAFTVQARVSLSLDDFFIVLFILLTIRRATIIGLKKNIAGVIDKNWNFFNSVLSRRVIYYVTRCGKKA